MGEAFRLIFMPSERPTTCDDDDDDDDVINSYFIQFSELQVLTNNLIVTCLKPEERRGRRGGRKEVKL